MHNQVIAMNNIVNVRRGIRRIKPESPFSSSCTFYSIPLCFILFYSSTPVPPLRTRTPGGRRAFPPSEAASHVRTGSRSRWMRCREGVLRVLCLAKQGRVATGRAHDNLNVLMCVP